MLAAGDTADTILEGYPWLELEDIKACLAYAHRIVGHEMKIATSFASADKSTRLRATLV